MLPPEEDPAAPAPAQTTEGPAATPASPVRPDPDARAEADVRADDADADAPLPLAGGGVRLSTLDTPTLTKADLSELLFDRLGLNKRESKDMVEAFFHIVHGTLVQAHDVKLSGFGNFNIRRKAPRPGRNPRTGESIPIKARHVVTFHASHKLKAVVQGDAEVGDDFD